MMKIKYEIIFEGEIEVNSIGDPEEMKEKVAQDFYERGYDVTDASNITWREVE